MRVSELTSSVERQIKENKSYIVDTYYQIKTGSLNTRVKKIVPLKTESFGFNSSLYFWYDDHTFCTAQIFIPLIYSVYSVFSAKFVLRINSQFQNRGQGSSTLSPNMLECHNGHSVMKRHQEFFYHNRETRYSLWHSLTAQRKTNIYPGIPIDVEPGRIPGTITGFLFPFSTFNPPPLLVIMFFIPYFQGNPSASSHILIVVPLRLSLSLGKEAAIVGGGEQGGEGGSRDDYDWRLTISAANSYKSSCLSV